MSITRVAPSLATPALSRKSLVAMAVMVTVGIGIAMAAIPSRANSLGGTALALGGIGAIRSAVYLIICQFAGRLSDRIGRRLTVAIAMLLTMVSSAMLYSNVHPSLLKVN